MIRRTPLFLVAGIAVIAALFAHASILRAQIGWPCQVPDASTTVNNTTGYTVHVTLNEWTNGPGVRVLLDATLIPGQTLFGVSIMSGTISEILTAAGTGIPIGQSMTTCSCVGPEISVCCITLPPDNFC